jgi:hypothetical protein
MTVSAYVRSHCTKFHAAQWKCWFLRPFIWSHDSGLIRFRDGSHKGSASNFMQISEKVRRRPYQWSGKREPYTESPNKFYCDCLKKCEDFAPNFGGKRTGCYITTVRPFKLSFSIRSWALLERPMIGHSIVSQHLMEPWRFNTEFIRALNLFLSCARPIQSTSLHLTSPRSILIVSTHLRLVLPSGHTTSRMDLKKGSSGSGAYARTGTALSLMLAWRPKDFLWTDASTSSGNCGRFFVFKIVSLPDMWGNRTFCVNMQYIVNFTNEFNGIGNSVYWTLTTRNKNYALVVRHTLQFATVRMEVFSYCCVFTSLLVNTSAADVILHLFSRNIPVPQL